jgi:hypothetical protein
MLAEEMSVILACFWSSFIVRAAQLHMVAMILLTVNPRFSSAIY